MIVTVRWARAAMDACCVRWILFAGRNAQADGKAVWSWRRDPGVKLFGKSQMATVARKAASPGRARNKPSNHCVGKAGMTGCTCGDLLVSFFTFGREAAGAVGARLSLRPLFKRGTTNLQNPGEITPRE